LNASEILTARALVKRFVTRLEMCASDALLTLNAPPETCAKIPPVLQVAMPVSRAPMDAVATLGNACSARAMRNAGLRRHVATQQRIPAWPVCLARKTTAQMHNIAGLILCVNKDVNQVPIALLECALTIRAPSARLIPNVQLEVFATVEPAWPPAMVPQTNAVQD
jgi:hypothetical protein